MRKLTNTMSFEVVRHNEALFALYIYVFDLGLVIVFL